MDELTFNVRQHVFQVVHVNLLVVHYNLDMIARWDTTYDNAKVDSGTVEGFLLGFVLMLLHIATICILPSIIIFHIWPLKRVINSSHMV